MPRNPRNGMVIAPKTEHGMKARFRCKDGFELKGNPIVVCSFGNWSGEAPKCEEGEHSSNFNPLNATDVYIRQIF
jgi:hypothetical protein